MAHPAFRGLSHRHLGELIEGANGRPGPARSTHWSFSLRDNDTPCDV